MKKEEVTSPSATTSDLIRALHLILSVKRDTIRRTGHVGMVDLGGLCSDTKWKFIFFLGGYVNQLLLFICKLVFSGINNFTHHSY